jgi:hypothetical protein
MQREELIREYIRNNGKLWVLESIDSYRDGGTKVLITNIFNSKEVIKYYIHKENFTIHSVYPTYTSDDDYNIITDKPTLAYIMDRLDRYKENLEYKMKFTNTIIENISIEGIRDRKINQILDK